MLDCTTRNRPALIALALVLGLSTLASAPLRAGSCRLIKALPTVIDEPGKYCLERDFEVDMDRGVAIAIETDHVVLDFEGHIVRNVSPAPHPIPGPLGVYAHERSHIVVRDGTVVNFREGISLAEPFFASTSIDHLVEDMRVIDSQRIGIGVGGQYSVVRDNVVENVTGVGETVPTGISAEGYGHRVLHNEVSRVTGDENRWGIVFIAGQDGVALGNRLVATGNGLLMEETGTVYRDNMVLQIPAGADHFLGGLDAGGNVAN